MKQVITDEEEKEKQEEVVRRDNDHNKAAPLMWVLKIGSVGVGKLGGQAASLLGVERQLWRQG